MTALAAPQDPTGRPSWLRPRRLRPAALALAAVLVAAATYAVPAVLAPRTATTAAEPVAVGPPADRTAQPPLEATGGPLAGRGDLARIDHAIGQWTANLARNGHDFLAATYLGLLYESRGRLTGDIGDYVRARDGLARALAVVPDHMTARIAQARLLQTLHDFPAALAAAQAILRDDPAQLQALATAGDALLELGDVEGAAASFHQLDATAPGAAVTARLSRVAFLRGQTATAVDLATRAFDEARAAGTTGASLGWYAYLAGTVALGAGAPSVASTWFDRAVASWPDGYLAIAGRARADAALGRLDAAVEGYRRAIAIAPQPDALVALGDLYALRGQAALAEDQYATVEAIARLGADSEQVYNRQLVLFWVNHERNAAEALRLAERELDVRKDAYGFDAYAWALLANGRAAEADAAMQHALAGGSKDAQLTYHAGMIAVALGDATRARDLLTQALSPAGALDPLSASRAAAALGDIR